MRRDGQVVVRDVHSMVVGDNVVIVGIVGVLIWGHYRTDFEAREWWRAAGFGIVGGFEVIPGHIVDCVK